MQVAAHAVAGVVLHHRIAVGFHVVLHRRGNVKQGVAGLDLAQALHQRFLGHPGQPPRFLGGLLPQADGHAAVAVVAVEIGAGVDLEQVAGLDHPLAAGDAVHHLVVDRGADAGREAVVALETGGGAHLADALLGVGVEVAGGHAGGRQIHDFPQHGGHDAAGLAHGGDLPGALHLHATAGLLNAGAGLHQGPGLAVLPQALRCRGGATGFGATGFGARGAGQQIGKEVHGGGWRLAGEGIGKTIHGGRLGKPCPIKLLRPAPGG